MGSVFNPNAQATLALFDLDKTLIPLDSDHAWGEFMVRSGWVDEVVYRAANNQFYKDYQHACLDSRAYLQFCLAPLSTAPMLVWQQRRDEYIKQTILPLFKSHVLDGALATVKRHRDRGDTLIMITATNAFVARPIARMFGFDDLIAVEPCFNEAAYTGEFEGEPTFGVGKCVAFDRWIVEQKNREQVEVPDGTLAVQLARSAWFYSDSVNDLPLLSRVGNPVIVNGDSALRAHGLKHDWLQLDWFA